MVLIQPKTQYASGASIPELGRIEDIPGYSEVNGFYKEIVAMPIKVGLVQINNSFSDACYLPYSVGCLQAYAKHHAKTPEYFDFIDHIYQRIPVDKAVEALENADIVGFSLYVWNQELSLAIARKLKRRNPNTLIVLGGPQVPDHSESFLRANPFVDLACHGEGERIFLDILENYQSKDFSHIKSISYLDKGGGFVKCPQIKRLADLTESPSPYLKGLFDELIKKPVNHQWLALWETNRGCPFSCAYCDWGTATNTRLVTVNMDRLEGEIRWFADAQIEFVFCCDSNFGLLPRDLNIVSLVAESKQMYGYPKAFSVQTTKNATKRSYAIHKLMSGVGLNKGVNLALQTVDQITLKNIGRSNISLESFRQLQLWFNSDGIETFTDIIVGLPGESYDSFTNGVSRIIEHGQHHRIQFINLAILPNALMGDLLYQKKHGLVIVNSDLINAHGSLTGTEDGINETQQLVVGTNTMPQADWVRTRVFAWMTSLLYFNKLLQIPFILLHEIYGFSYKKLVEAFVSAPDGGYPLIASIKSFFVRRALVIQHGGPEFCACPDWLNIYWPTDEKIFIDLFVNEQLDEFYRESINLIANLIRKQGIECLRLCEESVEFNKNLLKRPFQHNDKNVQLNYNVYEVYKSVLMGKNTDLLRKNHTYYIDRTKETWYSWEEWMKKVVWYEHKKGAYLYSLRPE